MVLVATHGVKDRTFIWLAKHVCTRAKMSATNFMEVQLINNILVAHTDRADQMLALVAVTFIDLEAK